MTRGQQDALRVNLAPAAKKPRVKAIGEQRTKVLGHKGKTFGVKTKPNECLLGTGKLVGQKRRTLADPDNRIPRTQSKHPRMKEDLGVTEFSDHETEFKTPRTLKTKRSYAEVVAQSSESSDEIENEGRGQMKKNNGSAKVMMGKVRFYTQCSVQHGVVDHRIVIAILGTVRILLSPRSNQSLTIIGKYRSGPASRQPPKQWSPQSVSDIHCPQ